MEPNPVRDIHRLNADVSRSTIKISVLRETLRGLVAQIVHVEREGIQSGRRLQAALAESAAAGAPNMTEAERVLFRSTLQNFEELWKPAQDDPTNQGQLTDEGRLWLQRGGLR
jgi:hypothetical protein